jgi:hypothetical protein
MKSKAQKRKEALERQEEHKLLSASKKILKLDLKLGGEKGAKRERSKLAVELVKVPEVKEISDQSKKHYQKSKKL